MTRRRLSLLIALLLTTAGWLSAPAAGCAMHESSRAAAWSHCCCDGAVPAHGSCTVTCDPRPADEATVREAVAVSYAGLADWHLLALAEHPSAMSAQRGGPLLTSLLALPPPVRHPKRYLADRILRL